MVKESKERLLAGAKELFLARGYAATTVDAICEKAELTKGSFYHFFDSKEALALAVLDWSIQRSAQVLGSGGHSRIADPLERAFVFLEDLENFSPELWSGGCLLGTFALELAETNPRMQHAVAQLLQSVADDFAGKLESIAAHYADTPAPTAAELAEALLGTLEGSIVLAKAHRDPTRIPRAIRGFRLSLAGVISQPV